MQKKVKIRIPKSSVIFEEKDFIEVEVTDGNQLIRDIAFAMTKEGRK